MEFNIVSGKVNLTDPCYEPDNICNKCNVPALNGTWIATITKLNNQETYGWGNRVESFEVCHKSVLNNTHRMPMIPLDTGFGVDSGQFGIFDASTYLKDETTEGKIWYKEICDVTLSKDQGGVIKNGTGFVSSTGYGDGEYQGYGVFIDGKLVYFKIVFIEYEDEEIEEDDQDEDED